jgi:hypothetical protein
MMRSGKKEGEERRGEHYAVRRLVLLARAV